MSQNRNTTLDAKQSDIMEYHGGDFLVVGFFTPDYFDLALALSGNLNGLKISHHLYACEKQKGEWGHQTLRKPSIVKRARLDYPDKALILMDVDCAVRGDVSGILDNNSDIAFPMGRKPMKNATALKPGTRVMLIRPSANSDRLLDLWDKKCRLDIHPVENDEIRLQMAIEDSAGAFAFGILPREFTGVEIRKSNAKDIIVHDSARDEARHFGRLRKIIKTNFIHVRSLLFNRLLGREYNSRLKK